MVMFTLACQEQVSVNLHHGPPDTTDITAPEIPKTVVYHIHRRIAMSRQHVGFNIWFSVLKGHHTAFDQLLNLVLQGITVFNIMTRSSLVKSTMQVRFEPPWQWFRNLWRIPWLDKIFDYQGRVQFCICHRNRVKRDLLPLKVLMMIVVVVVGTLLRLLLMLLLNRN